MAGVGRFKGAGKDACRVAGAVTRDAWVRHVRRSWRWFPERGCILPHQILRFAKMILPDRCSTMQHFVWLGFTFSWQVQYFGHIQWKKTQNALVGGCQLCAQLSDFLKAGSQNCFVSNVVGVDELSQNFIVLELWTLTFCRTSRRIDSVVHIHFLRSLPAPRLALFQRATDRERERLDRY